MEIFVVTSLRGAEATKVYPEFTKDNPVVYIADWIATPLWDSQ